MTRKSGRFCKAAFVVLAGNLIYFWLMLFFPLELHQKRFEFNLGTLTDAWFFLCIYGLIDLLLLLRRRQSNSF